VSNPASEEERVGTVEEIDRSPAIAFFLSAESFLQCAQKLHKLHESNELRLRFSMPIYYLYCHSLELVMKSFLRAKGLSTQQLGSRKFGHKLEKLWEECLRQGLQPVQKKSAIITEVIRSLDPFAEAYKFRYIEVGYQCLPALDDVQSAVSDLVACIRPICHDKLGDAILDRDYDG
jgi:hypothetical protein